MPASHCISLYSVGVSIGSESDAEPERICKPKGNVALEIGNASEISWPIDILREAGTGSPLLSPDGTPLFVAE